MPSWCMSMHFVQLAVCKYMIAHGPYNYNILNVSFVPMQSLTFLAFTTCHEYESRKWSMKAACMGAWEWGRCRESYSDWLAWFWTTIYSAEQGVVHIRKLSFELVADVTPEDHIGLNVVYTKMLPWDICYKFRLGKRLQSIVELRLKFPHTL